MLWERLANAIGLGHKSAVRAAARRVLERMGAGRLGQRTPPHQSAAFTSAFIALAAKMAKADGVAVAAEALAFERFLEVPPGEVQNVRRLYDLAKRDTAGFDVYAERIGRLLRDEPELKQTVLECLLCVASSDGVLHPAEDEFLMTVAEKFGFERAEFRRIRALFVRDAGSPYEILGLAPDAPTSEVKARFRKLAVEMHPDRLHAAGAPAAVVKAGGAKLATITAAYKAILDERRAGTRA